VAATFATGDTKRDPAGSTDNSGWNTKSYPAATASNRTAGIRFDVDTRGYQGISVSWSQLNSATASRYLRFEYTTNGGDFVGSRDVAMRSGSVFTNFTVSLETNSGVANNRAFGFRLVSEFESSVTNTGAAAYIATATDSDYSKSGTIRLDLVTVSGTLIPGDNTAPAISRLTDQTLHVNQSGPALAFAIGDAEDSPDRLTLGKASSNPAALPESGIVFARSGSNCTATLTAGSQAGISTVTLWVVDTGGRSNSTAFALTVLPANTAPVISVPVQTNILVNGSSNPLAFTVGDGETAASNLMVTASSSNPLLLPGDSAHLLLGGSGSNRTVTLKPASGQIGVAPVLLTVSDGVLSGSAAFPLLVTPSTATLLCDNFDYPNGAVTTNSAFFWGNRSGTPGQCLVTNGTLRLDPAQAEDVQATLPGGPYYKTNNSVLYSAFRMKVDSVPGQGAGYFASFANGSAFHGRVGLSGTNSAAGAVSLFVSNGSDTNLTWVATNLATGTLYTIVSRYNVASASTRLWINPSAETDVSVAAADLQTNCISISLYAFREDAGVGAALEIDNVRAGLTFDSVHSDTPGERLDIEPGHGSVILRWNNPACFLQTAASLKGPYTNLPGAGSPFTNSISGAARFFRLCRTN
jgi:hypothetical protein